MGPWRRSCSCWSSRLGNPPLWAYPLTLPVRGWSWPRHPLRLAALAGTGIMWACTMWGLDRLGSRVPRLRHSVDACQPFLRVCEPSRHARTTSYVGVGHSAQAMDPSVPEVGVVVGALVAEWMIHLGFTNGRAGVATRIGSHYPCSLPVRCLRWACSLCPLFGPAEMPVLAPVGCVGVLTMSIGIEVKVWAACVTACPASQCSRGLRVWPAPASAE